MASVQKEQVEVIDTPPSTDTDSLASSNNPSSSDPDGALTSLYSALEISFEPSVGEQERVERLVARFCELGLSNETDHAPLLLHNACHYGVAVDVVQRLVEASPKSVEVQDEKGWLPLHVACRYAASEEVVHFLLEAYPDSIKVKDENGMLPLYQACRHRASEEVVRLLLEAYPDGAKEKNRDGWLPVHVACRYGASEAVVHLLLGAYPDGAKVMLPNGWLPLNLACREGASEAVVRLLVQAYPASVQMKNKDEWLPLHVACRYGASAAMIKLLLEAYPDSVKVKDDCGWLPLHLACRYGAAEAVPLLAEAYPAAVHSEDQIGKTPREVTRDSGIISVLDRVAPERLPSVRPSPRPPKVSARLKRALSGDLDVFRLNNDEIKSLAMLLGLGYKDEPDWRVGVLRMRCKMEIQKKKECDEASVRYIAPQGTGETIYEQRVRHIRIGNLDRKRKSEA